jgi:hypothetical protein
LLQANSLLQIGLGMQPTLAGKLLQQILNSRFGFVPPAAWVLCLPLMLLRHVHYI